MRLTEILAYEFVQNAVLVAILASLLCGLVGTFVVVKRLVFISGGVSHAAFGGLGICHFFGLPPLLGAGAAAVLAALLVSRGDQRSGRSRDALIGILWAVGMAVGVVFIARTPGYAPNLTGYLFGDILAVSRPLVIAMAVLVALVLTTVSLLFKEMVAVAFDEEFARAQGLPVRRLLMLLMVVIALSVVLLIQAVGVILAIALLTIPPTISLSTTQSMRGVILQATILGLVMTLGGLALSFAWDLPSGPAIVLLGFSMLLVSNGWKALRTRRAARIATATVACLASITLATAQTIGEAERPLTPIRRLEFLGETVVPALAGDPVPVGGLSGLTYDARRDRFYAISDDRAEHGAARFYTLEIQLREGRLEAEGVRVAGWTALTLPEGRPFGKYAVDPEGIALTSGDTLLVASEGAASEALPPFLREFSLDGRQLSDFPLGERYRYRPDGQSGTRDNLAMESASLTPDEQWLFSATENALAQDGPKSTLDEPSPARILRFDVARRSLAAEYLYWVEPVVEPSAAGSLEVAGVVEILALDADTLLTLERSFSFGAGNSIRLYEVDLSGATDILSIASLQQHGLAGIAAAHKRLLLDFNALGIEPENLEGMALGPPLADGTRTLLLIADDNFNPAQRNQLLAFALHDQPVTIPQIQGAGHRSPLESDWVRDVEGVVTAVDRHTEQGGFWMQAANGAADEPAGRSQGLFVFAPRSGAAVGDRVRVDGGVREIGSRGSLTVTRLAAGRVEVVAADSPLPPPVVIGAKGRLPPAEVIDDDGLQRYDPCCDAIDFYESLEGMRVEVDGAVAVSGTSRFGEIAVVPDHGEWAALRSRRGGVVLRSGDANPERLVLDDRLTPDPPAAIVGDLFDQPVVGVLHYSFGNFKLLVESWPSTLRAQSSSPPRPKIEAPTHRLTVASYNVLNLDALDPPESFRRIAESIVEGLGSPDLLGLQEVQDDNGAADAGVTTAGQTLERLIAAIVEAGGPRYDYRQIDPGHNLDGGQPDGNIRVVWMFRPQRVQWTDRGSAGADDPVEIRRMSAGVAQLSHSPGRIAPTHPAFAGDEERGWDGSRKCLVGEATFLGERLFLVNCHLKSKRGDDPLFGATQPPRVHSEEQRNAQARQVQALVHRILAAEPDAAILVVGDMNEHDFRAPMRVLAGSALENLTERVPRAERYSYNYDGNSQLLDHILASRSLAGRTAGIRIRHLNADHPDARRASDHDPVLAWFDLD